MKHLDKTWGKIGTKRDKLMVRKTKIDLLNKHLLGSSCVMGFLQKLKTKEDKAGICYILCFNLNF